MDSDQLGNDPRLDRLHKKAVSAYQKGSFHRWTTCLAASRIVGLLEPGLTKNLAYDLSLSISQVENLAKAGITYRYLRPYGLKSETRQRLTHSHFTTMGELWQRYEFSPMEAISILDDVAEAGASVAAMKHLVDDMYLDLDAPPEWLVRWNRWMRLMDDLPNDYGIPSKMRIFLVRIKAIAIKIELEEREKKNADI